MRGKILIQGGQHNHPPTPPMSYNLKSRKIYKSRSPEGSPIPNKKKKKKEEPRMFTFGEIKLGHPSSIGMEKCTRYAEKALERFNSKECARFKPVEIGPVFFNDYSSRVPIHMNFTAKTAGSASVELFYAELYVVWNNVEATEVRGCCLLEKADSGRALFTLVLHMVTAMAVGITSPGPCS